jgi:hypothetical protein
MRINAIFLPGHNVVKLHLLRPLSFPPSRPQGLRRRVIRRPKIVNFNQKKY